MANVALSEPITMVSASLQLGTDTFASVGRATFTPQTQTQQYEGIDGTTVTIASPAKWTLDIEYPQDVLTTASLANYLHAHEGETVTAVVTESTGGATITVQVVLVPGALGGQAKTLAVASASFPCVGKPAIAQPESA